MPTHRSVAASGDIVIIGAGLAGLYTALKLAPLPVTVLSPARLGEGASSAWAQGGIAAAVGEGDSPGAHASDTIAAGAGLVDPEVATLVAEEGPGRVRDLLSYGVPFDRDLAGHFLLSREAAHSQKRVVRVSGDRAGAAIMQALIASVRKTASIRVLEGFAADGLSVEDGRVCGVRLSTAGAAGATGAGAGTTHFRLKAAGVVLATGGIGGLYALSTNPPYARGQGLAFAARAGATIMDAEFVQFHPTALDVGVNPAPLASEALRGEGAILINGEAKRFMLGVDPAGDLAPRDIVARAVFAELAAGRGAFLDCRTAIGAHFPQAFPTVFAHAQAAGLNPVTDLLPVAPAQHYHMGGVRTDRRGRTDVAGLWAAGEVAATGLHGANRLASNSLIEAAVFAGRVAEDIAREIGARDLAPSALVPIVGDSPTGEPAGADGQDLRHAQAFERLRGLMSDNVGVIRDGAGLKAAKAAFGEIETEATARGDGSLADMALAARFIARAALSRVESRGGHYRSDFPATGSAAAHSTLTLAELDAGQSAGNRPEPRVVPGP